MSLLASEVVTEIKPVEGFDPEKFLPERMAWRAPPVWDQKFPNVKAHPSPISLGGGMPNSGFFPVKSIDVNLKSAPFAASEPGESAFHVKHVDDKNIDLKSGLQYANPLGLQFLQDFVKDLIETVHKPAYADYAVTVSSGNGNSINKALDAIFEIGDTLIVDQFNYLPVAQHVRNFKGSIVPLKVTDGKTDIAYLSDLLDKWDEVYPDKRKPKALYTIPNGSNPFGVVTTLDEKKAIYALADKHDFLIIEDDPYGYLALPKFTGKPPVADTVDDYVSTIGASYLTIDTKGRVLRVETFSKNFAPGLRLGFIVAHAKFVRAITIYSFVVTGQLASGPSQILLTNTVHKMGGVQGFLEWNHKVRNEYAIRTYNVLTALYASKPYKEGKFTVLEPEAGMFLTLKFPSEVTGLIYKTIEEGVAVVSGKNMKIGELGVAGAQKDSDADFIRITTAALDTDDLAEAIQRLIVAIDKAF